MSCAESSPSMRTPAASVRSPSSMAHQRWASWASRSPTPCSTKTPPVTWPTARALPSPSMTRRTAWPASTTPRYIRTSWSAVTRSTSTALTAAARGSRSSATTSFRSAEALSAEDLLELGFVHPRTALDASLLGLVAELVIGPASRAAVGTQPAPPARREVLDRGTAGFPGLAMLCPLLVDRARGDLLRLVFPRSALEQPFLDVFVLALAFVTPGALWHLVKPPLLLSRQRADKSI